MLPGPDCFKACEGMSDGDNGNDGKVTDSPTTVAVETTTAKATSTTAAAGRRRRATPTCPAGADVCKVSASGKPAGCGTKGDPECGGADAAAFTCTKEKGCCCTGDKCNSEAALSDYCGTEDGKKLGDANICQDSGSGSNAAGLFPSVALLAVSLVTLYGCA